MDLYLKFPNEATATNILFNEDGSRRYVNIDVIGTIYKRPVVPEGTPEALDGWHVNVRLVSIPEWDEETKSNIQVFENAEPLIPYQIQVTSPMRIWA